MTADRKRKTSAAKSPSTKKTPSKSASASRSAKKSTSTSASTRKASAPRAESKPRMSATRVAGEAARQLAELTGKQPEAITGIERTDEGWLVMVDVVELHRVPATTDVLGRYEVETDDNGDLMGYRRASRYTRGSTYEE